MDGVFLMVHGGQYWFIKMGNFPAQSMTPLLCMVIGHLMHQHSDPGRNCNPNRTIPPKLDLD